MTDPQDPAIAVLAQQQQMQWLLSREETSMSRLTSRAMCIPPTAQQACAQAAAAVLCQAGCRLQEDPTLALLESSRDSAAAQLLQLYAAASEQLLLESVRSHAQLLQLGLQQMDSHPHIPGEIPAAALLTQPLHPPPAALFQPHGPGCLGCLTPHQAPHIEGASPSNHPITSVSPTPTAPSAAGGLSSAAADEAVSMEGVEEGVAPPQGCDPVDLERLCSSLQAAADSMDVSSVDVQLLLQQLGAAGAAGGMPQALQQQLSIMPEGVVQLLLQQAAAAGVVASSLTGATAAVHTGPGEGGTVLLAASLLPLLLGMEAAGSPTLLACLVTAADLDQPALMAAVLTPLLASPELRLGHVQLLGKLLKERPATGPRLLAALQQAVAGPVRALLPGSAVPTMAGAGGWREAHVHLLQALLDACPGEVLPATPAVLCSLRAALTGPGDVQGLQKSVKLVQLLKSLVLKSSLSPTDLQVLEQVVSSTQTFLTKGLMAQVQRLQVQEGS